MPVVVDPSSEWQSDFRVDLPSWVTRRGADVRGFDRRSGWEVFGPKHRFAKSTDLLLTNGLIRFWLGPRGMQPYLNVQALGEGIWRECGTVVLGDAATHKLMGHRLIRRTPDHAWVELVVADMGSVYVGLRRGLRMIEIEHGSNDLNAEEAARTVRWQGMPPVVSEVGELAAPGVARFDSGLSQTDGEVLVEFLWPTELDRFDWNVAFWWSPEAASGSVGDSGLTLIQDENEDVAVNVVFDGTTHRVGFDLQGTYIETAPISFGADEPVFIEFGFGSNGMRLSARPMSTVDPVVVTGPTATDPGPLPYKSLMFAAQGGTGTWGAGTWGAGTWGSYVSGNGVFDNVMIFDRILTDVEAEGLSNATVKRGGLSGFEGRMVWYAPFDVDPVLGGAVTTGGGLIRESAAGADGFHRGLVTIESSTPGPGLRMTAVSEKWRVGACLTTETGLDTASRMQQRLRSDYSQETRIR